VRAAQIYHTLGEVDPMARALIADTRSVRGRSVTPRFWPRSTIASSPSIRSYKRLRSIGAAFESIRICSASRRIRRAHARMHSRSQRTDLRSRAVFPHRLFGAPRLRARAQPLFYRTRVDRTPGWPHGRRAPSLGARPRLNSCRAGAGPSGLRARRSRIRCVV